MLPLVWIMALLYFRVGLSLYVISKWAIRELEGPWRLLPPWMGSNKPTGTYLQTLRASHGGIKYSNKTPENKFESGSDSDCWFALCGADVYVPKYQLVCPISIWWKVLTAQRCVWLSESSVGTGLLVNWFVTYLPQLYLVPLLIMNLCCS